MVNFLGMGLCLRCEKSKEKVTLNSYRHSGVLEVLRHTSKSIVNYCSWERILGSHLGKCVHVFPERFLVYGHVGSFTPGKLELEEQ